MGVNGEVREGRGENGEVREGREKTERGGSEGDGCV